MPHFLSVSLLISDHMKIAFNYSYYTAISIGMRTESAGPCTQCEFLWAKRPTNHNNNTQIFVINILKLSNSIFDNIFKASL